MVITKKSTRKFNLTKYIRWFGWNSLLFELSVWKVILVFWFSPSVELIYGRTHVERNESIWLNLMEFDNNKQRTSSSVPRVANYCQWPIRDRHFASASAPFVMIFNNFAVIVVFSGVNVVFHENTARALYASSEFKSSQRSFQFHQCSLTHHLSLDSEVLLSSTQFITNWNRNRTFVNHKYYDVLRRIDTANGSGGMDVRQFKQQSMTRAQPESHKSLKRITSTRYCVCGIMTCCKEIAKSFKLK